MTRTCSIPGCQSPHLARGWCNRHYRRWWRYADPAVVRKPPAPVKPHHLAQMTALVNEEGLCRSDIAAITGWSVQTVGRHVGHLVPARTWSATPDVARYRRMIKAAAAAEYGQRDAIARRFGLKNAMSLNATLVTARRRVAEAEGASK
ncbi:hypothetical protein MKK88_03455 [Methylobacterium sp. E-005]|uniref:hypothetical protein n=1 Tax=Methylobacterium sp. E-005 TaxID=2836549 RepID=UPI001FB90901|nr:hypothetical protein [Methylobacterium sp. E-005]MCJ2085052.1 hypothetical protein [Methylobacterium sp. E-005]